MKKENRNAKWSWLLIVVALLFNACERQGPMGPEGPQGPDGENTGGSGGAGSIMSFTTAPGATFSWEEIDGWGDYEVYHLEITGGGLALPDSVVTAIDQGLALVYLGSVENDWYRLPLTMGVNKDEIYDYHFQGKLLLMEVKTKDDDGASQEPSLTIGKVKILLARPSQVNILDLP